MSLYLTFRSRPVGGSVVDPYVVESTLTNATMTYRPVGWPEVQTLVGGKNVIFAVHGFNVSLEHGARSLGQFERQLQLTPADVYFGVLWPGDYWIPAINYPFEGRDSMDCGRRLASCFTQRFDSAQSVSFVSHSLGARLVLEAVKSLDRRARLVCLMAGAINRDCLQSEYDAACENSAAIALLASRSDMVLKLAFRAGDTLADLLNDDHHQLQQALGYAGPPLPAGPPVASPWQISNDADYGHGNYLPSGSALEDIQPGSTAKWLLPAAFFARAFRSQAQIWPT